MMKAAMLLNVVLVVLLVVMLLFDKTGNYGVFILIAALPLISISTFAQESPARSLLAVCWMGNSVGSALMGLTSITSLLMISRAGAFGLVLLICAVFAAVAAFSASVAFRRWRLVGKTATAQGVNV